MRDADGSVSWNDKMITGLSDGNRAEGESLLLGFIIQKASGRIHICAKKQDVASDCAQRENMPGHIFVLPMYVREAAGGRSCG